MKDAVYFKDIITGQKKQYRVPVWQRPYAWDEKNWNDLWNDLMNVYKHLDSPNPLKHYLGAAVFKVLDEKAGGMTRRIIIDGQQRITTLILLLMAIRDKVMKDKTNDNNEESSRLVDSINNNYLFNPEVSNFEDKFRLILTESDFQDFKSLALRNNDDVNNSNSGSGIVKAYGFFLDKIDEKVTSNDFKALDFCNKLVDVIAGLEFTSISLEESDSPNRIFETLNYRGKKLATSDLVRNLFMMSIKNDPKAHEVYENIWRPMEKVLEDPFNKQKSNLGNFLTDYIAMVKKETIKSDDIYAKFKKIIDDLENVNDTVVENKLREIKGYADLYGKIIFPEREKDGELKAALISLKSLLQTTCHPFLLKAYKAYEDKNLSREDFIWLIKYIESFIVRRFFSNLPTNSYNKLFASLCKLDDSALLSEFIEKLYSPLDWPDDQEFESNFKEYPIYKKKRWVGQFVLGKLEESFSHPEKVNLKDMEIEHIMPQTLTGEWIAYLGSEWKEIHDDYCDTIGNLTLISKQSNSEIKQELFEKKKVDWYQNSHIELTRELCKFWNEWKKEQIIERGKKLADKALKIWAKPPITRNTESDVSR